jgi:small-conductance mechanosensitive channel/CRP-like cAMP-binding protein
MPPSLAPKLDVSFRNKFKKILIPLIIGAILGFFLYYGGDAYQGIGLEGIGTARIVFGYALGIGEFLVLAIIIQRLVQFVILDWLLGSSFGGTAPRLLSQLSSFIIYLFAVAAIMGVVFKKDLTVILAASGAAGIVIGMALRELILDLFAGLALNLDRTIKIGDSIYLSLPGNAIIEGTVKEISWRTTQLLTRSQNIIIMPNSRLSSAVVTNYSQPKLFFKLQLMVVLDFEAPGERVVRILQAAAMEASEQFAQADTPQPSTTIKDITPDGVRYVVSIYPTFDTRTKAKNLTFHAMLRHLHAAGLNTARPKSEVFKWTMDKPALNLNQPDSLQIAKLIGSTFLFKDLLEDDRQLVATLAPLRKIPAGTFIVHAGEAAIIMFFLVEGLLITESTQRGKSAKISKVISPGNLIGGEVMLLGSSYESTVKAKTASLICEINYKVLGGLLVRQPTLIQKLSQRVAKQLTEKIAQNDTGQQQWKMSEADLTVEVTRNLKRSFTL